METEKMTLLEKLNKIQVELKAPKNQYNEYGGYSFRNCEDILEALKPFLAETKTVVTLQDEIVYIEGRYYVRARATLHDCESDAYIDNFANAREEETKKGMDTSQITGASSSYARKYALNGLFGIDDVKDSDTTNKTVDYLTDSQLVCITNKTTDEQKEKILKKFNIDELTKLNKKQASEVISLLKGSK